MIFEVKNWNLTQMIPLRPKKWVFGSAQPATGSVELFPAQVQCHNESNNNVDHIDTNTNTETQR